MDIEVLKINVEDGGIVDRGQCKLTIANTYQIVNFTRHQEIICTGWLAEDSAVSKSRKHVYTYGPAK